MNAVQASSALLWSTIQLGLAIVCSCLPMMGPLLRTVDKLFVYLSSKFRFARSALSRSSRGKPNPESNGSDGFRRAHEYAWARIEDHQAPNSMGWAYGNHQSSNDHILQPLPSKGSSAV